MNPATTLFLLVGLPAAGKTTRAREVAERHPALRLTPDEWMIPLFGDPDAGRRRDVLEGRMIWLAHRCLELGTSVVLDFGFWGRDERSALRSMAEALGVASGVLYLPVDAATQRQRVALRYRDTPGHTFPMNEDDLVQYRSLFQEPDADELAGRWQDQPPQGWTSWAAWAAGRWPSLPVLW